MSCGPNICLRLFILVFTLNAYLCFGLYNKPWTENYENNKCPKLYPKNFLNYMPVGNLTAGNYTEKTGLKGLKQCVMECCLAESCNIVFIYDARCFHIECVSDELCLPLQRTGGRKWESSHVSMILVKPVLPNGFADECFVIYTMCHDPLIPFGSYENQLKRAPGQWPDTHSWEAYNINLHCPLLWGYLYLTHLVGEKKI